MSHRASAGATRPTVLIAGLYLAGALASLWWRAPALALLIGSALALALGNPLAAASERASRWLIQASIVGLGFGMPLGAVASAGWAGIGVTVLAIGVCFAVGPWLGRRLRIDRDTSILITVGTAICGGSAIAAMSVAIGASARATAAALAILFALNAVALGLFPSVGQALQLTDHQFATWAAIAIHDTSSVVGAAASYGPAALLEATILKLARALWIVPLTLVAGFVAHRKTGAERRITIPWFIGCFVLASLLRSILGPAAPALTDGIVFVARLAMVAALFLIGTTLEPATLRAVGLRPVVLALVLWVLISSQTLFLVLR